MNRTNYKKMLSFFSAAEIKESERLWPHPFEAPDVPLRADLRLYTSGESDKNLNFQIENSIHCLRALTELEKEECQNNDAFPNYTDEGLSKTLSLVSSTKEKPNAPIEIQKNSHKQEGINPRSMEIWRTKDSIPVQHQNQTYKLKIKNPHMVLLLDNPKESEFIEGERIFRAIAVTVENDYSQDLMGMDEIEIRQESGEVLAAHLFLSYPVSIEQLDSKHGRIDPNEYEKLNIGLIAEEKGLNLMPADGAGVGPDDEFNEIFQLERERLIESTSYLSYYADYNLSKYENFEQSIDDQKIIHVDFTNFQEFDLAASNKISLVPISVELKKQKLKIYFSQSTTEKLIRISVLHKENLTNNLDGTEVFINEVNTTTIMDGMAEIPKPNLKDDFSISFKTREGNTFIFTNKQK